MGAILHIFTQFTPNSSGGRYYVPKSPWAGAENDDDGLYNANTRLLNKMISDNTLNHFILNSLTFKIYEEYIDISQVGSKAQQISYIAIDNETEIMFYYVDSIKPLPQGYRIYTRQDNWATYIAGANITNVRFTKSNLQVGNLNDYYYYTDEVVNYDGARREYFLALNRNLTRANISVLAVLKHRVYQNFNDSLEVISVCGFDPKDIAQRNGRTTPNEEDILETITEVLNIYAVGNGAGTAQILKVYLYDNNTFVTKSLLEFDSITSNGNKIKLEAWELPASINELNIDIGARCAGFEINTEAVSLPASQYLLVDSIGVPLYFGTKYNNIKLPPFVLTYSVKIRYEIGKDYFKITVIQGTEERDITTAFEVGGVANTGTLTATQAMAKWLGIATQATGGVFQIAKGGSGIISGISSIGNAIAGTVNQNGGTIIGGGNGLTTFNDIIKNNSGDVWYFSRASRTNQGKGQSFRIMRNGAYCNIQYEKPAENLLNYLSNFKSLYTATTIEGEIVNVPYIACEAVVDNIPYEAIQDITNSLSEGIQITYYGN